MWQVAKRKAGLLDEEDDVELAEALKKATDLETEKKVKNLSPNGVILLIHLLQLTKYICKYTNGTKSFRERVVNVCVRKHKCM